MARSFHYEVRDKKSDELLFHDTVQEHAQGFLGTSLLQGRDVYMKMYNKYNEELDASNVENAARIKYLKERDKTLSGTMRSLANLMKIEAKKIDMKEADGTELSSLMSKIDLMMNELLSYIEANCS